jgi:hypothetical protein
LHVVIADVEFAVVDWVGVGGGGCSSCVLSSNAIRWIFTFVNFVGILTIFI